MIIVSIAIIVGLVFYGSWWADDRERRKRREYDSKAASAQAAVDMFILDLLVPYEPVSWGELYREASLIK